MPHLLAKPLPYPDLRQGRELSEADQHSPSLNSRIERPGWGYPALPQVTLEPRVVSVPCGSSRRLCVGCSCSLHAVRRVRWCGTGRPPGAQRRGPLARPTADRESGRPVAHPSQSPRIPCSALAACSSRRSAQQFATCGFNTITPSSLVTSKLVNPAAPCAWQVVMSTRRWLAAESCWGGTVVTFRGCLS